MTGQVLERMISENMLNDVKSVYRDMQLPTVMRLRTAVTSGKEHPLLGMRLSLLDSHRSRMKELAEELTEDRLDLSSERDVTSFERKVKLATDACMRVLECTDDPAIAAKVAEAATALAGTTKYISSVLFTRDHFLATMVKEEHVNLQNIAANAPTISKDLQEAIKVYIDEISDMPVRPPTAILDVQSTPGTAPNSAAH